MWRGAVIARRGPILGMKAAPRRVVIARRSAILGAGPHRAAWLSRGALRFRVRVRAAPPGYRAARHVSGRGSAPRRMVIARRVAIPGAGPCRAMR